MNKHLPKSTDWTLEVIAGLLLSACGGGKTVTPGTPVAPAMPVEQAEYRIGPGDSLQIFVWNHPELSVTVPVRPDGMISTPLVENMRADGKTPSQLARDMEKALSEYVRSPTVNVIVTNFVGAYGDQIRVVGQAQTPQCIASGKTAGWSPSRTPCGLAAVLFPPGAPASVVTCRGYRA